MLKAEIFYRSRCNLGEAPVWHKERGSCFWVDVEEKLLFEYGWEDGAVIKYQLDHRISLVIPFKENEVILALQGGIARFDLQVRTLEWLPSPDVNWDTHRCNDGGVDAMGRLWISTMHLEHEEGSAALYLVEKDCITQKINWLTIPNGIVWSPDHTQLYFTDSLKGSVFCYQFDLQTASLSAERTAIQIPSNLGLPDGMAMDQEGMLWQALWGGFGVGRFNPETGEMLGFIDIPAPHVSCCCFAGPEMDHLMITTARSEMTAEDLLKYPESGNVFIVKMNVNGLPLHQPNL